ncbi:hypothetical protein GCM10009767_06590 [Kocuria aegyptia]|uniref:Uncharacterized protein n=1 Tax=Kocuria aegyptia TaxID=330943 RepID=A0ABN2K866_9MICC
MIPADEMTAHRNERAGPGARNGLEVFDKPMTPMAEAPSVTIQRRGVIPLTKAPHHFIDSAQTVELPVPPDSRAVALRPSDEAPPHGCAVHSGSDRGS